MLTSVVNLMRWVSKLFSCFSFSQFTESFLHSFLLDLPFFSSILYSVAPSLRLCVHASIRSFIPSFIRSFICPSFLPSIHYWILPSFFVLAFILLFLPSFVCPSIHLFVPACLPASVSCIHPSFPIKFLFVHFLYNYFMFPFSLSFFNGIYSRTAFQFFVCHS